MARFYQKNCDQVKLANYAELGVTFPELMSTLAILGVVVLVATSVMKQIGMVNKSLSVESGVREKRNFFLMTIDCAETRKRNNSSCPGGGAFKFYNYSGGIVLGEASTSMGAYNFKAECNSSTKIATVRYQKSGAPTWQNLFEGSIWSCKI